MPKTKKKVRKKTSPGGAKAGELTSLQDMVDMPVEDWDSTEPAKKGMSPFPIGIRTAKIVNAEVDAPFGPPQISYHLVGTGDSVGYSEFKNDGMKSIAQRGLTRREVQTLGIEWNGGGRELPEKIKEAIGLEVSIDVKQDNRKEYPEKTNIYFRDVLNGGEEDAAGEPDPAADASDASDTGDAWTRKDILALDEDGLTALAKECDIDPDKSDTWEDLAEALCQDQDV